MTADATSDGAPDRGCTLCDLPVPNDPVTGPDGDVYCCEGCRRIDESLSTTVVPEDSSADSLEATGPDGVETGFLRADGMHCSTCETYLESRGRELTGVSDVDASYPTEVLRVRYDPARTDLEAVARALSGGGYRLSPIDEPEPEDPAVTGRLIVGGFFGMMVMLWYLLFLYPWYLALPSRFLLLDLSGSAGLYLMANVWVLSTIILAYTGAPIFRGAIVSLRAGEPNMDLLIAMAAGTAYLYSSLSLILGQFEVYFDVAVVIVLAVTFGNYYEQRLRKRALGGISDIVRTRIESVNVVGRDEPVPLDSLDESMVVMVSAGDRVPVDGTVQEGVGAVDESLVTGESLPVRKHAGEAVLAGTTIVEGELHLRPDHEGARTVDRLLTGIWNAASATPGPQRVADRIAGVFVPLVLLLAVGTTGVRLLAGGPSTAALLTGLAVLVVSCPCAMGLATPLALGRLIESARRRGIVLKTPDAVESTDDVDTVVLDKTGTLTTGDLTVVEAVGDDAVLRRGARLERAADHPIARAVARSYDDLDGRLEEVEIRPGVGLTGRVEGAETRVGSRELFDGCVIPDSLDVEYDTAESNGRLPVFVGDNRTVAGLFVLEDSERPGWSEALTSMEQQGHRIAIITGDTAVATARYSDHPAVDETYTGIPPDAKAEAVRRLRGTGGVVFVGDGSNDGPAIAAADLGIAIGDASALAVDAADAVVVNGDLRQVPELFTLHDRTHRRIRENFAWAFTYNAFALPLAVLGVLTPLWAAIAMATSSLLVVVNSVRSLSD